MAIIIHTCSTTSIVPISVLDFKDLVEVVIFMNNARVGA